MNSYFLGRVLALALALLCFSAPAVSQSYPARALKMVVGFPPGGVGDILARLFSAQLSEGLNQPVVVENRPGAGGTIGAGAVAKAPADGTTLLFVTSGHAGNATLYDKLPYDSAKDFDAVIHLVSTPVNVVVNAASRYRSVGDLIADARAHPGKLNYGAGGGGATLTSLAVDVFRGDTKIDVVAISYKGTAPALTALMAGEVDFCFDTVVGSVGLLRSGRLRALAVTSLKRSEALPEVPTLNESAVPGFDVTGWFGVLVPAGTPRPAIERLNLELNKALRNPLLKERLRELGADAAGGRPEEFGRLIAAETARWGAVIRRLGLKAD
jgi:tripartite-type tricarboxylate transporter receptor subunit TctC